MLIVSPCIAIYRDTYSYCQILPNAYTWLTTITLLDWQLTMLSILHNSEVSLLVSVFKDGRGIVVLYDISVVLGSCAHVRLCVCAPITIADCVNGNLTGAYKVDKQPKRTVFKLSWKLLETLALGWAAETLSVQKMSSCWWRHPHKWWWTGSLEQCRPVPQWSSGKLKPRMCCLCSTGEPFQWCADVQSCARDRSMLPK